jgi:PAS domain S-box-containing protein
MHSEALAHLYRRMLPRLPIIVALAFGLYSLALVGYTVSSWRYMKQDADRFLVADSTRRASALGDLADEIGKEAVLHANLYEIRSYLTNRDLGMSPRYGLDASLQAIEERFKEHSSHSGSVTPSRIFYLGADGQRLADTHPGEALPPLTGIPSFNARLRFDPASGLLIAVEPVTYKGLAEGVVVTTNPIAILYRNLISSSDASQYRELLLTTDGRELPGGGSGRAVGPELLRRFVQAPTNAVLSVAGLSGGVASSADTGFSNALLANTPVPGLSLQLVTLLPAERAHGHLASPGILVAAALVPILLLLGAVWFDRLRLTADRLQEEVRTIEQKRLWAEERNLVLQKEIARRELIERALKDSEERWQLAVRGANDGIWDWNVQTGAVHFSARWKTMLGYTTDEIVDDVQQWISRIHPGDLERTLAEVERHQRGETEFYQCEHRLRCKDGHYKWVLARGQALQDAKGKAVRMSGSHTDITERHLADARVRDRTEQLNTISALSPDGFVSFDADRRIKYINPAFLRMTALDEAKLIGLDEAAFSAELERVCAPETGALDMAALRAMQHQDGAGAASGASAASRRDDGRCRIDLASPRNRVLEVTLREAQAETVSQILYFSDITHETEVDRLKSEFLSTAAHELRTPMASIMGYSELILTQEFDEAERRDFLEIIHRNALLMANVINELLDLDRIEARRGKDF